MLVHFVWLFLSNVFNTYQFCASLTNFCFLEPHLSSRTPTKSGKRTITNFAFFPVFFFHHSNVRIIAKTCLTQNWKIWIFPILSVVSVGWFWRSHLFWLWKSAEISTKIRGWFLISSDTQICCEFTNGRLLDTNSLAFRAKIIFKTFLFCLRFENVSWRTNVSAIFGELTHATYLHKFIVFTLIQYQNHLFLSAIISKVDFLGLRDFARYEWCLDKTKTEFTSFTKTGIEYV